MAAYGILANIPFIIIQRYNRIRLVKVLEKIERKEMYKVIPQFIPPIIPKVIPKSKFF
jgi:hypothetical protein